MGCRDDQLVYIKQLNIPTSIKHGTIYTILRLNASDHKMLFFLFRFFIKINTCL